MQKRISPLSHPVILPLEAIISPLQHFGYGLVMSYHGLPAREDQPWVGYCKKYFSMTYPVYYHYCMAVGRFVYIMPQFQLTQTKNLDHDAMPLETSDTTVLSEKVVRFVNLSTQISQVIVIFLSFHFEVGVG